MLLLLALSGQGIFHPLILPNGVIRADFLLFVFWGFLTKTNYARPGNKAATNLQIFASPTEPKCYIIVTIRYIIVRLRVLTGVYLYLYKINWILIFMLLNFIFLISGCKKTPLFLCL